MYTITYKYLLLYNYSFKPCYTRLDYLYQKDEVRIQDKTIIAVNKRWLNACSNSKTRKRGSRRCINPFQWPWYLRLIDTTRSPRLVRLINVISFRFYCVPFSRHCYEGWFLKVENIELSRYSRLPIINSPITSVRLAQGLPGRMARAIYRFSRGV